MSSRPELRLDWCSHAAAKYAMEHWHYARIVPKGFPHVRVGVWETGIFRGCVVFGRGACSHLLAPYGLNVTEGCELVRIALRSHATSVSRIVSIALRMLHRAQSRLRLVVSYADPVRGHHGGIYQAGGWIYSGLTAPDAYYWDRTGRRWHSRNVSESGMKLNYGRPTLSARPSECRKIITPGKHRYLFPLDAEMRARILPLAKPYPKRAPEVLAAARRAIQLGGGGATPTLALPSDTS